MQLHQHIGIRLEAGYGVRVGEIAAQLAVHFEDAGAVQLAVHYWQQTGENAWRRHAYLEALSALRKGLALLAILPESPEQAQRELTLLLSLGELLIATEGIAAPEVGEVYTRAHVLCQQVGEAPQRFQVLQGLHRFHVAQAQLPVAGELAQQLTHLTHHQREAGLVLVGQAAVGAVALLRGDLVAARAHLEHYLSLSDTQPPATPTSHSGHQLRVSYLAWMMQVLWELGYADQARQCSEEALALTQQNGEPASLAYAQLFGAVLSQYRRDTATTYVRADALMAFATAQGLGHRVELGRILRGWAVAMQGDAAAGVAHIQQAMEALQHTGLKLYRPYFLALLAEASGQAGQPESGLTALDTALRLVAATEERWWEAELYRLQGALLLQRSRAAVGQAEACFQQALDVARRQQAKALELRAALSLARLWQGQGQHTAARQLLVESYRWFTEGFDTADLQESKALLVELGGEEP
jgi:predicted ATPase